MSKRHMPNLDELDAGMRPTLGIRDLADLEEIAPVDLPWGFGRDHLMLSETDNADESYERESL